jgi:4-hydroxybenzoate polyprenyltransferase
MRGWLSLVRMPNLLTVPGDLLAGYAWAGGGLDRLPPALGFGIVASLFFYTSGLIFNDLADREEDGRDRPERPLPAGLLSARVARLVAVKLMAMGGLICLLLGWPTALIGLLLAGLILLYNFRVKASPLAGPLCMGSCRAANVALGAAVLVPAGWGVLVPAAVVGGYVVLVTYLARNEARATWMRPSTIGVLLGLLLPVQAALCFAAAAPGAGLLLLFMWPTYLLLARHFAPS